MKHSKLIFASLLLILNSTFLIHNSSAQCLYIESILADACNKAPCPVGATEGENEMVLFKVGPTALNIAYMTTATASLTPTWPNLGNLFKGWQTPGAITNPLVAALNSSIVKCGYLLEPVGGVLPANAEVLIITSTNMCSTGNSFANLTDTLYVLFQVAGNTNGHFLNNNNTGTITTTPTGTVAIRNFTLNYTGTPSCSETVSYEAQLLTNQFGTYGGSASVNDGASIDYDALGNATYVNKGCQAPYIPIAITTTAPSSVCVNATANVTGMVSGPAVTYTWTTSGTGAISVPTGTLSGSAASSTTLSPTYTPGAGESGTVTFTLTAQGKCLLAVLTNTVSINVIALPAPVVSSSAGAAICFGNSTVLSVTNQAGVGYTWNPGSGSGTSFTVAPVAQTIYTLTATNACAVINSTFTVDVNALPTVSVASASVCPGFTATITASGASTYTWNTGPTGASISASPATTTQYTVTGTDVNSCVNTATGTILVYNSPTVTVNSPTICVGGTVTLNAGGALTFTWSTTQNGSSISDNPSGNTSYTVVGTDANGCTNFAVSSVTVNPLPTVTTNSVNICPGNTATLTASGASTYTWNTTQTGASITSTPTVTTNYTVTGTDLNGCVNTATTSIAVVNSLTVSAVTAKDSVCSGSSTTLTGNGAGIYTWSPASTLSSSSGTSVTATPTVTTTYTVVGSSGTCRDSFAVTVNVNNLPVVTTSVSPSNTVCPGTSVTLTGVGANTYTWTGGVTNGVSFTPASTQTYMVTGTNSHQCTNSASITVTVNTLTVTASSSTPAICIGQQTATLTATGATNYTWSPAGSLSSPTGTVVTASPTVATTYTVTGVTGICSATGTVSVNINLLPVITANTTTTSICNGGSVTLTGGGGLPGFYFWTGGVFDGTPFNPTTTLTYTVTGIDINGCSNFAPVTVNVKQLPIITVNSSTICLGQQTATLTATAAGAMTYTWNTTATTNSITVSPITNTSYTVNGTDVNGCNNFAVSNVTVNTPPVITVNLPTPSICLGTTTLTLSASGASTYTWSTFAITNSITVSPNTNTSYTVFGTDINGCNNFAVSNVTVNSPPIITANSPSVCVGSAAILNASGASSYTWNTSPSQTGASISVPGTTASYTVTGTDLNGCVNTAVVAVSVFTLPNAAFSTSILTGQVPATVIFTNASTGATSLSNYWNFANGDTSHQLNPTETYSAPGTYGVVLTVMDNNGCMDTASAIIVVTDVPVVIIIPNVFSPNGDNINDVFMISGTGISTFNCKIYDRWGIFLYEWNDIKGYWDGKNTSSGKEVTDGTYFFILSYSDNKAKSTNKQGYLQLVR